jgi:hypothetical protein
VVGTDLRILGLAAILAFVAGCSGDRVYKPQDGDIVFQTSRSPQSLAIQRATKSPYSHMGIVFLEGGTPYVLEAVQPVISTPLAQWIQRGQDGHYVAKRLRDASQLTPDRLENMQSIGEGFLGKDYDWTFQWSDDRIYCSELVWKIYAEGAGIQLGELETLADFNLSDPMIQAAVQERFGDYVPLDENVVSPAAIFRADNLETVGSN